SEIQVSRCAQTTVPSRLELPIVFDTGPLPLPRRVVCVANGGIYSARAVAVWDDAATGSDLRLLVDGVARKASITVEGRRVSSSWIGPVHPGATIGLAVSHEADNAVTLDGVDFRLIRVDL